VDIPFSVKVSLMIKDTPYVLIQRLVEEVGSLVLTLKRVVIGRLTSRGNYVNGGSKRGRKRER
jgi:16S rRNA U516 pseudouridylate synthase RsuA-like enzyme